MDVSLLKVDQLINCFLVTKIKSDFLFLRIVHDCTLFKRSMAASFLLFDDMSGGDSIQLTKYA